MSKWRLAAILIIAIGTWAIGYCENNALLLNLKDGNVSSVTLSEISNVKVSDGKVVINTTDGSTSSTAISLIYNITFGESAGVTEVSNDSFSDYTGDVYVYGIDGRLAKIQYVESGETVNLDDLENGIYILKANDKALKIRKQ